MSAEELTGRRKKIFELAKLLAQHVNYLPDSERQQVRVTLRDCLQLREPRAVAA